MASGESQRQSAGTIAQSTALVNCRRDRPCPERAWSNALTAEWMKSSGRGPTLTADCDRGTGIFMPRYGSAPADAQIWPVRRPPHEAGCGRLPVGAGPRQGPLKMSGSGAQAGLACGARESPDKKMSGCGGQQHQQQYHAPGNPDQGHQPAQHAAQCGRTAGSQPAHHLQP